MKTMQKSLILLCINFSFNTQISKAVSVELDSLMSNVYYSVSGADTIKVTNNLLLPSNSYWEIEPGTVVEFQGFYELEVQGTLIAVGTAEKPIVFTAKDTLAGWHGMRYYRAQNKVNDTSRFTNCIFEFGKGERSSVPSKYSPYYFEKFNKLRFDSCKFWKSYINTSRMVWLYKVSLIFRNCEFSYSNAMGVVSHGNLCKYLNCKFINNKKTGLFADSCILYNCNVSNNGGGVNSNYFTVIENSIIKNNKAGYSGAGICAEEGICIIKNNYIVGNNSYENGGNGENGGGVFIQRGRVTLLNNTIVNNKAHSKGGGCAVGSVNSALTGTNNIFWGNTAGDGNQFYFFTPNCNFYNNIIEGDSTDFSGKGWYDITNYENNLSTYPGFVDSANIHRLATGSVAINAGIADTSGLNLSEYDILRNPRIVDGQLDIGCYEYNAPTEVPKRIKTMGQKTVDEDFTGFSFGVDTLFDYYLGNQYLVYNLVSADTNVVNLNYSKKKLNINARENKHGRDTIVVSVNDGLGGLSLDTLIVEVLPVNDAPELLNKEIELSIDENPIKGSIIDTLVASDVDEEDVLCYFMVKNDTLFNEYMGIELDSLTGIFSIQDTSVFNFEEFTYLSVKCVVKDRYTEALADSGSFILHVNDVNDLPYFTNLPDTVWLSGYLESPLVLFKPEFADPDNDHISVRVVTNDYNIRMNSDNVRVYDAKTLLKDNINEIKVEITAFDGIDKISETLTLMLNDVTTTNIEGINSNILSVYPVPATNRLYITNNNTFEIQAIFLTDMNGRTFHLNQDISGGIDISHFSTGVYMINLRLENGGILREKVEIRR